MLQPNGFAPQKSGQSHKKVEHACSKLYTAFSVYMYWRPYLWRLWVMIPIHYKSSLSTENVFLSMRAINWLLSSWGNPWLLLLATIFGFGINKSGITFILAFIMKYCVLKRASCSYFFPVVQFHLNKIKISHWLVHVYFYPFQRNPGQWAPKHQVSICHQQ